MKVFYFSLVLCILFMQNLIAEPLSSKVLDLKNASIIDKADNTALAKLLQSEVEKRTGIKLKISNSATDNDSKIILNNNGKDLSAETFSIETDAINKTVTVTGSDNRGLLYGIGNFIEKMKWSDNVIDFPDDYNITSSPEYSVRGHQLGYRNTANSYDAWAEEQFEEYIKDLALLGANTIEGIPFDKKKSPVMPESMAKMRISISRICKKYDLEYWVWTPVEFDLNNKTKKENLLKSWEEFYSECPRLDAVFVPGGDPGHNDPKDMMPFLSNVAKILRKYHPQAKLWISLQGFDKNKTNWFLNYMNSEKPDWLTGVIHGPQSPSISYTRNRLPRQYPINSYPDVSHSVLCQYPIVWWDPAFALTEGREFVNPRPRFYTEIHNRFAPYTNGFVAYSDGVHDDVNKVLWTKLGWNSKNKPRDILIEYCKYFFGWEVAEKAADGILALETNWVGSAALNGSIDDVWAKWKKLEKENPKLQDNWRWRQLVMRAGYDEYVRKKLLFDTEQQNKAMKIINDSDSIGSAKAIEMALRILSAENTDEDFIKLRQHFEKDGEDLNKLIGLQMSVEKYKAKNFERCAVLDFLDRPLNDKYWLEDQFKEIEKLNSETEKVFRLKEIANWTNPAPGSTYDIVGSIGNNPHTMRGEATYLNTEDIRNNIQTYRTNIWPNRSKYSWLSSFWPKGMVYEGLDSEKKYIIRATGKGDALLSINGEKVEPSKYSKELGGIKEYKVPQEAASTGKLLLEWKRPKVEDTWNWRKQSYLCEVWLIPEK